MEDWKKAVDRRLKELEHHTVSEKCDFCGNWDVLFDRIIDHKPLKLCRKCYDELETAESDFRAFRSLFMG